MTTLQAIEAGLEPDALAFYSVHCAWWTTDSKDLGEIPGAGLPCCPYCGSVLMQASAADFISRARENPERYGPDGLAAFARAHHSSGLHAVNWSDFRSEPIRFPRQTRELSTEKSIRCVRCGSEFSEVETAGARGCPNCGATSVPMAIAQDVTVKVNWHELRVLGIWANNWAAVCDEQDPTGDAKGAIAGTLRRLEAQHPNRPPLTLMGELW